MDDNPIQQTQLAYPSAVMEAAWWLRYTLFSWLNPETSGDFRYPNTKTPFTPVNRATEDLPARYRPLTRLGILRDEPELEPDSRSQETSALTGDVAPVAPSN